MFIRWKQFYAIIFIFFSLCSFIQADQAQIKVIVFDFGSVIAKTDKEQVNDFITQMLNIPKEQAENAIIELKQHTNQEKDEEEFWINYARENNIFLPDHWLEQLNGARLCAIHEVPGMVALVNELQNRGFQTALLSNVRKSQSEIKRKLGYYDLFNPVILSCDVGIKKPDPMIFKILLDKLEADPETVLFVDNQERNIDAARSLGIDGIVFKDKNQFVQELKKRGI